MGPFTSNLNKSKAKKIYSFHSRAYRQDNTHSLKKKEKIEI